jgi:hypothetical protein
MPCSWKLVDRGAKKRLVMKLNFSLLLLGLLLAGCASPSPSTVMKRAPQPDQAVRYALQLQQQSVEGISTFLTFAPDSQN